MSDRLTLPFLGLKPILQLPADRLVLHEVEMQVDERSVTFSGRAACFGRTDQPVTVTFTGTEGQMAVAIALDFPTLTLAQVAQYGLLAPGFYETESLPDLVFTNVRVRIDPVARVMALSGEGPAGRLPLGVEALDIREATLKGTLHYTEAGAVQELQTVIGGRWAVSSGVPVILTVSPGFGWQMQLAPDVEPVSLTGGLADLTDLVGQDLDQAAFLPAGLTAIGSFALAGLSVLFGTNPGNIGRVALRVTSTQEWPVVPPALSITGLTVALTFDPVPGQNGTRACSGTVTGQAEILGVRTALTIPVPAGGSTWALEAYPNVDIDLLGDLGRLARPLIGENADVAAVFPPSLNGLGALRVANVRIEFDPTAPALNRVSFLIGSSNPWRIVPDYLALDEILVALTVSDPLGRRTLTGTIAGVIQIGEARVLVQVQRPVADADWSLQVQSRAVPLPGLSTLASFVGGADFAAALPAGLQQLDNVVLEDAQLDFNLSQGSLARVSFTVVSPDTWEVLADTFAVGDLLVSLDLDYTQDPAAITGAIGGTVDLVGVEVVLLGQNQGGEDGWVLSGKLVEGTDVNLTELIQSLVSRLLPGDFSLPAAFPTLRLTAGEVALATGSGRFHISGTSTATWRPTLAGKEIPIAALTATLDAAKEAGGQRSYTFTAAGDLRLGEALAAHALFRTSNSTEDTVITASLTAEQVQDLQLPGVANTLIGSDAWESVPVPRGYPVPELATAGLYLNLTRDVFILYGDLTRYGRAAMLVQKLPAEGDEPEENWGFALAAALSPDWKFSHLSPDLQVIDEVLQVEEARLLMASYATSSAAETIANLALVPDLPDLSRAQAIGRGVNFYAKLNFTGSLFSRVGEVLRLEGPYTISALIRPQARESEFTAGLGSLTILEALSLEDIALQYTPAQADRITLAGSLALVVDETTVRFPGRMVVDNEGASFTAGPLEGKLPAPLGMSGITLEQLSCALAVTYATDEAPRRVTASLSGQVNFYNQTPRPDVDPSLTLEGRLLFQDGRPVLVLVALDPAEPLGIGEFFYTVFGGNHWEQLGFMDIAFVGGSMYYARCPEAVAPSPPGAGPPESCTLLGKTYRSGFNLHTTFQLFAEHTADIDVNVQSDGITATGQLREPLDLTFAAFTDKDFTGKSPEVGLSTRGESPYFFLHSGFQLLGENFGTADVNVRTSGLEGTLTYAGDIEAFKGSGFSFTYNDKDGFKVNNWPINLKALQEFEEKYQEVMAAYQKGGCAPLGNLLFKEALSTRFALRPSLSGRDGRLVITLKGRYEIAIRGQDRPFLYVQMPELDFVVPAGVTLRNLPEKIGEFLVDSAGAIIQKILDDPAKFTAFIGTVMAKEAIQAALNRLVCNAEYGTEESATVAEEAAAAAGEAEAAAEAAATAATSAEAATAAAAAAASSEAAADVAAAVGGGLAAAGAAVAAAVSAAFAAEQSGGRQEPIQLDAPAIQSLTYDDGRNIVAGWAGVFAPAGYQVELLDGGGRPVATQTRSSLQTRASFSAHGLAPGRYRFRVQTLGKGESFLASEPVTSDAAVTVLAPPQNVALAYRRGVLEVTWDPAETAPAGYQAVLMQGNQEVHRADPVNAPPAQFDPVPLDPGAYTAKVRTLGNAQSMPSEWVTAASAIAKLPVPQEVSLSINRQESALQITWQPVAEATGYRAALIDTAHDHREVGAGTVTGTQWRIGLEAVQGLNGTYQAQVRALGDETHVDSNPGVSPDVIAALPAPEPVTQRYDAAAREVVASWGAVVGAAGYGVQVVDRSQGDAVVATQSVADDQTSCRFERDQLPASGRLQVRVQAVGDAHHLDSPLATAEGELAPLPAPTGVTQAFNRDQHQLTVTWTAVAGAGGYQAEVVRAEGEEVVATQTVDASSQPQAVFDAAPWRTPTGGQYRAQVRALGSTHHLDGAPAAAATSLTILPAPTAVEQAYDATALRLTATWQPVPGAAAYQVQVIDEENSRRVVAEQSVPAAGTDCAFDVTPFAAGGLYRVQVQARGNDQQMDSALAESQAGTRITLNLALRLGADGYAAVPPNPAFNLGTGDFTFEAWIRPAGPGTILSRKSTPGGHGNGGFLLVLQPGGAFKLATDNGFGFYEIVSTPTQALDGQWHHIAGVRQSGQLSLYLDGLLLEAKVQSNGKTPMDISNSMRLLMGATDQEQEPFNQYSGDLDRVMIWKVARTQGEVVADREGLVTGAEAGLVGYWTFDGRSVTDRSATSADGTTHGKADYVAPGAPRAPERDALRRQMVAYYPLQGNTRDASGHSRDAKASPQVRYVDGFLGSAAAFTAPGAYVVLPGGFPRYAEYYTLAAWVYLEDYRSLDGPANGYGNLAGRLAVRHQDGAVSFWFYYDSPGSADNRSLTLHAKGRLALRRWQHVLVTYDHSTSQLAFYIDGKLDSQHDLSSKVTRAERPHLPWYGTIGGFDRKPYMYGSTLNGRVSDVLLLDVAADSRQIAFLSSPTAARMLRPAE